MLKELLVENIALIESAKITFENGFNVLTGETGAGKSLVIDAINAITGERVSKDLIRTGTDNANVTAVFCGVSENAKTLLERMGIDVEDDVIIKKSINGSRSSIHICGQPATAAMVRQLAPEIINIHGQHDNQALLNSDTHCSFIDSVAQNEREIKEYSDVFFELKQIKKQLDALDIDEDKKQRERELFEYQVAELDKLKIEPGERDKLKAEFDFIQNSDSIKKHLDYALSVLKGDNGSDGALNLTDIAAHELENKAMSEYSALTEKLRAAHYSLETVVQELQEKLAACEIDEQRARFVSDRLHEINRAINKYGGSEDELFKFYNNAKQALKQIDNSDALIAELEEKLADAEQRLVKKGEQLTKTRIDAASKFSKDVCEALACLDMPNVTFYVNVGKGRYTKNGCDTVEFMISANVGEPPKPIIRIASGGELSRIMLAIKSVLSKVDGVDTLIFDEIDIGISGKAAQKVAVKLREVAKYRQVICVTHLAQIACEADRHLLIQKTAGKDRTVTNIIPLEYDGRVNEIARIIAGNTISENVLETAREMLDRRYIR